MILELANVITYCSHTHQKGGTVVLVTGVFDILHEEHKIFLAKAKRLGTILVVGLETDNRVKRLKGDSRPVNQAWIRAQNLEKWKIADVVFILPEKFDAVPDYRLLLQQIKPEILAVSSHTNYQNVKEKLMQEIGGKVVVAHQHNPAISTTILLRQHHS